MSSMSATPSGLKTADQRPVGAGGGTLEGGGVMQQQCLLNASGFNLRVPLTLSTYLVQACD